jgi:hypothetical protein
MADGPVIGRGTRVNKPRVRSVQIGARFSSTEPDQATAALEATAEGGVSVISALGISACARRSIRPESATPRADRPSARRGVQPARQYRGIDFLAPAHVRPGTAQVRQLPIVVAPGVQQRVGLDAEGGAVQRPLGHLALAVRAWPSRRTVPSFQARATGAGKERDRRGCRRHHGRTRPASSVPSSRCAHSISPGASSRPHPRRWRAQRRGRGTAVRGVGGIYGGADHQADPQGVSQARSATKAYRSPSGRTVPPSWGTVEVDRDHPPHDEARYRRGGRR